jgi:hypothetical protein
MISGVVKQKSYGNGKDRSRFDEGMTTRKARTAKAKPGMDCRAFSYFGS